MIPDDDATSGLRSAAARAPWRDGGGARVVDAVRDLAADHHLHRLGGRHRGAQHEPFNNYVNQFGPFWAEAFGATGLYTVYSAWWFLLILAFLVVSTSLCIARNTPKVISDLRAFKERVREQALRAFHHKAEGTVPLAPDAALARMDALLGARGWRAKVDVRRARHDDRGTQGHGEQGGLPRGALVDRADLPGGTGRRRPGRARADGVLRQEHVCRWRADQRGAGEHRLPRPTRRTAATCWCPRAHAPAPPSCSMPDGSCCRTCRSTWS